MESSNPPHPISGRGAPTNLRPTRTGSLDREADGDWLDAAADVDGAPPPLRTTVTVKHPKTIIARNKSPDVGLDRQSTRMNTSHYIASRMRSSAGKTKNKHTKKESPHTNKCTHYRQQKTHM